MGHGRTILKGEGEERENIWCNAPNYPKNSARQSQILCQAIPNNLPGNLSCDLQERFPATYRFCFLCPTGFVSCDLQETRESPLYGPPFWEFPVPYRFCFLRPMGFVSCTLPVSFPVPRGIVQTVQNNLPDNPK